MIGGYGRGRLITLSFACGELKVWDCPGLTETKLIPIRGCLTGEAILDESWLYLISRAIEGVERVLIDKIIS